MDSTHKRDNHTPSCSVCQRRKVKCDRVYPCAACTKSGLDCAFPPPRHVKRARRNTAHQHPTQVAASVPRNQYSYAPPAERATAPPRQESGMNNFAGNANANGGDSEYTSPESTHSNGVTSNARLVADGAGYRYVNNHLWTAISADGQVGSSSPCISPNNAASISPNHSRSAHATSENAVPVEEGMSMDRSFLFGGAASSISPPVEVAQLSPAHTIFLWQTYLSNVDPAMKICHAPTVQPLLLGHIGRPNIPRADRALISAIYFISVVSLTDEQCRGSLQETRVGLLCKYKEATESALSAAGFITTTDTTVLQALILYLAALRSLGEIQTVWSLFGLAIRIAGVIGLPRDGTSFGLSPFEVEMRRRLWWGIVYFDGRMAELVGQDGDLMGNDYEAASPSNLNDSDLFPAMTRLPEPSKGPTDAIYLQARVLCLSVSRNLQSMSGPQGTWHRLHEGGRATSEKLDIMQRIEQRFNEEILEPCDPTVPLQWLSINTARTFATKLRLISRIPVVDLDREWENVDGFSENAFLLSMDLLQLQVDLWCEPMVQQWKWHWQAHFQWYALVTLLRQTRLRHSGQGISRAWGLIQKAFEIIIPTLELNPKKNLLLNGIHGLLEAAKRQQDQSGSANEEHKPHIDASSVVSPLTVKPPLNGFSSGYGSRAHSALIPGMDMAQLPTPIFGHDDFNVPGDAVLGFDFDAIDWVEFDRLTSELCQQ